MEKEVEVMCIRRVNEHVDKFGRVEVEEWKKKWK